MQQFKIRQDGFKEIKKQLLIRILPLILIGVTAGIVIGSINSKDKEADINIWPILIPIIAGSVGYGIYLGIKKQKALFESYILTLTNNLVTREQLNTPTILIYFNDIKEITKSRNGSFTIKGRNTTDLIIVPCQIDNYDQLENALTQIRVITGKSSDSFLQKNRILATLLTTGLMLSVYIATNKIIVAVSGILFIGLMTWSFVEVQRSKNIDSKTKRNMWFVLVVVASVIFVIFTKLAGQQKT